jgi:hypothetical protein
MAAVTLNENWLRPSIVIFSTVEPTEGTGGDVGKWDFGSGTVLYLTDDNRSPLKITPERIESRRRMIDGTMRSVHVADKYSFSTSWENIPSRKINGSASITSDGFGAGIDIRDWYDANYDDFWILLVYDNDDAFTVGSGSNVEKYNVFFNSFDFTVTKRGQYNDLWDVTIDLVEV